MKYLGTYLTKAYMSPIPLTLKHFWEKEKKNPKKIETDMLFIDWKTQYF